jgi:hypothetical protein
MEEACESQTSFVDGLSSPKGGSASRAVAFTCFTAATGKENPGTPGDCVTKFIFSYSPNLIVLVILRNRNYQYTGVAV